jgi:hypothetical protein
MTRRWSAVVIAVVALAVMAPPLIRGDVFSLRDHNGYFQPMRWFTAVELRNGRLPLWNPYNASGEPWLANPQTGVFYPPTWLFAVVPFPRAYILFLLLHMALLGGSACALLGRRVSASSALIGAVSMMVCGPLLSLLDVSNNYATFAWLPLVLWCAVAGVSARISALVIAMSFLAGEPFFASLGAFAFAMLRWRTPRQLLLTALGAAGLTAVQLFPFLEILRGSDRAGTRAPFEMLRDSMPPRDWLRIGLPPHPVGSFDPALHQHFLPLVYCGGIVVLLALLAAATSFRRRDVQVALAVVLASIIASAGSYLAPVAWLYVHLPLKVFRYPARLMAIGALAIAILAAIGWEWIAAHVTWRWLALVVAAAIAVDGLARAVPLLESKPFSPHPVPHAAIIGRDSKFLRLADASWMDQGAWIEGYLNLYDRRFDAYTAAPLANARYLEMYDDAAQTGRLELLDTMSIGYVLASRRLPAPFVPMERVRGVTVYRNPLALPMAYFRGDDGRYSQVTFVSFTTSSARVYVDVKSPGVVILTQQEAPGWEAAVDGARAESSAPVSGVFRAVRVPRGHHVVDWKYRPWTLRAGAACTFLASAWLLFGVRAMRSRQAFVKRV